MPIETTKHEKLVLTIVQDYLNQTRYFNMNKIIPFINSKLKMNSVDLNYRAIEEILRSLVKKKLIDEGTKFTKMDVLKNKIRNQIYNFILKHPGVYFNTIVKELKIHKPVIVWHINMLVRFEFITREEFENHEIYFDSEINFEDIRTECYTTKEKSEIILNYLKENNIGITKTRLSLDLKMHINTVEKYLKSLEKFNIIFAEKISKKNLYFLNEDYF